MGDGDWNSGSQCDGFELGINYIGQNHAGDLRTSAALNTV